MYRQLEIVYLLLNKKVTTAKYLADRFDVSQRTIYRDVDKLCFAGIPIYTEKGKGGGISLLPDFVLNKSLLDDQEQNEILSALKGLSSVKPGSTKNVLQKMSAIFNKPVVNWLEIDFSNWSSNNRETFEKLKTAILEHRVAEFDYFSVYGKKTMKKTRRQIEPFQLWFKSSAWYVRGYCLSKKDVRTFKITRIANLLVTDKNFTERNYRSFCNNNEYDETESREITIKLKIAPEMIHRVFDEFGEDQAIKQKDGSFIIEVTWAEDDWVYGRILSFGEHIEVLEPEHIRNNIKSKLAKNLKKY